MRKASLVILAIVLAGCATSPEVTAWNIAREVNTPAGYQNFVQQYPSSSHVAEARKMVGTSKMDQIMKAESVAECVRSMKTNPDPKTVVTIRKLAFKAAQKETSVEDLYDFLVYFNSHPEVSAIRSRLEGLEFNGASGDPSPVPMEYFLLRYPQSNFAVEGRKLLEKKSYEQVKSWGNPWGFKAFLQKFPDSPHALEIRGSIPTPVLTGSTTVTQGMIARMIENSPWLKRYGCALVLSAKIKRNSDDVDSLRQELYKIEKGSASGPLPESCSTVSLVAKSGAERSLDEGFSMLPKTEKQRKDLASYWNIYDQRHAMAMNAVNASSIVADELESAELSEDVLGSGPLGGLDVGREKASVSARKALERFKMADKTIEREQAEIKRLLIEMDGLYRPLQYYVSSCLVAK